VDEVTCSEATDEEDEDEEEDEEEEETEDEEQDDEEKEAGFFKFTGAHGRKPPGVFDFGTRSSLAAQQAASAAAELRSAAAGNMSSSAKSVLSDAERANLLDALARSRRELEEELTKQHMYGNKSAAHNGGNVPPPSEDAFTNVNAPCPSKAGAAPPLRKPGVTTDTSARTHGTDAAWAAAMRRHAERSQSGASASSSSTPRGAGETPRGMQDGVPNKPGAGGKAAAGMDEAMTVAQRTAEEAKERGNERFRLQRWEAAAREYTSAVNLSRLPRFQRPDLAAVYLSNRAACYIRLQRFEEAVEDCEAALALNSDFWKAGARAGKALLMMGEFERALAHLEHAEAAASAKFEETPTARRMVDEIKKVKQLIDTGDSERALSCIKSIINETPNAFPLELLHLQTLLACGRFDEALPVCERVRDSKSSLLTSSVATDLQHMHAMTLVGLAKLPQAVSMLRDLLRNDPDNQKYQTDCRKVKGMHAKMTSGIDALEAHRFSEARQCFTEALALDPSNDRFAALMLSYRASTFQKQREEVVDSADSVARARKEVEEATAELERAQRRMVKGNERLQLFARREEMVRKQFEADERSLLCCCRLLPWVSFVYP
jgi:tetratricopeptide (TPR) repeat protein